MECPSREFSRVCLTQWNTWIFRARQSLTRNSKLGHGSVVKSRSCLNSVYLIPH